MNTIIETSEIAKIYQMGTQVVNALQSVSININKGEYVAFMGPSGSGKSTLMNIVGCLDTPTSGTYILNSKNVSQMTENELADIRNKEIGFVFQTFNLLPRATALENVALPLIYAGYGKADRQERAMATLESVGLADRAHHNPTSYRAGSDSVWPSPGRWSTIRASFWPMSPQETWIPKPPMISWTFFTNFTQVEIP